MLISNSQLESAYECMKTAYDAGINFFDTAEGYAGGASETVMGETIKKYGWPRCELVISTKINWGSANASSAAKAVNCVGLSRKHIIEGLKASLERLQLDYVDIVYAHRPDRDTPMEEVVRAFNYVIEKGQAFYWGTSEWSAEEIADAWRIADKLRLIGPAVCPWYHWLCLGILKVNRLQRLNNPNTTFLSARKSRRTISHSSRSTVSA